MQNLNRIGGIILARLDSSRLPNKQLQLVRDRYMLDWLIERAKAIKGIDELIIATSDRSIDDPLEEFAVNYGIKCFRGAFADVAGRVLECTNEREYDAWVRINGDSPLLDYRLFDFGLDVFRLGNYDVVTNAYERTYPIGNSVEIIDTAIYASGYSRMSKNHHYEHVTSYFYENSKEYNIYNFVHKDGAKRKVSLAVDTHGDLERYTWMLDQVECDHMSLVGDDAISLAAAYANRDEYLP